MMKQLFKLNIILTMFLFSCNKGIFMEVKSSLDIKKLDTCDLHKVDKISEWGLNGDGYSFYHYRYRRPGDDVKKICEVLKEDENFVGLPIQHLPENMLPLESITMKQGVYKMKTDEKDKRNFFLLIITLKGDFIYYKQVL